jgi:hypothetical protein
MQSVEQSGLPPLPLPNRDIVEQIRESISLAGGPASDGSKRIVILATGSNDAVHMNPSQTKLLNMIAEKANTNEFLKQNAVFCGSAAHGRAPPLQREVDGQVENFKECIERSNKILDNIVQEAFAKSYLNSTDGVPFIPIKFADCNDGQDYRCEIVTSDLYIPEYPGTYGVVPLGIDLNDTSVATKWNTSSVFVTIKGDSEKLMLLGKEPSARQGIKTIPDTALCFGGMLRASQMCVAHSEIDNETLFLPDTVSELKTKKYHKPNALFVRAAGGFIDKIVGSDKELLDNYKPVSLQKHIWEYLSSIGPSAQQLTDEDLQDYSNTVVESLVELVQYKKNASLKIKYSEFVSKEKITLNNHTGIDKNWLIGGSIALCVAFSIFHSLYS